MPMVAALIQKQAEAKVLSALMSAFKPADPQSSADLAKAIAEVVPIIIMAIQTTAQVAPGIAVATAGSPTAQVGATLAPGVIL